MILNGIKLHEFQHLSEFRNCIDCGCKHEDIITSKEDCPCECHYHDLVE